MSVEWAEGDETKGKEVRRSDQLLTSHAYTHLGHAQVHIGELLAVNPNVCLKPSSPRISQTPSHNRQQQQPTNRRKTVNSPAAPTSVMPPHNTITVCSTHPPLLSRQGIPVTPRYHCLNKQVLAEYIKK